jgi:hypothetical protein
VRLLHPEPPDIPAGLPRLRRSWPHR